MFKSLRDRVRGYKLISGTGHAGHGWDFPNGIREMDMTMIRRGMLGAAGHEKRVEVILAYGASGKPIRDIARSFNLSHSTISMLEA